MRLLTDIVSSFTAFHVGNCEFSEFRSVNHEKGFLKGKLFLVKLDAPYFEWIQATTSAISFLFKPPRDLTDSIKASNNYDLRVTYSFCLYESKERLQLRCRLFSQNFFNYRWKDLPDERLEKW